KAQVDARGGKLGIDLDGLSVMDDGFIHLPLAVQSDSQVVVAPGVVWVRLDGRAETSNSAVVVMLPVTEKTAQINIVVECGGVECEGCAVGGNGLIDSANVFI